MRRILGALGVLLLIVVVAASGLLLWSHARIRSERAPIPSKEALTKGLLAADRPVRLSYINTATQRMARSTVLDPDRDARPEAPFVMSHPSFVLEWPDGRILLVDTGMTEDGALAFGKPLQKLAHAEPIEPGTTVVEGLGEAARRVAGVVFTHLHIDHVGALPTLCDAVDAPIQVFMTRAQAERPNYTTKDGLSLMRETRCARIVVLDDVPVATLPGFPGVGVIAAGGHTPGTQVIAARVRTNDRDRLFAFTGDVVNAYDGLREDIPKPWAYRTFLIPEDEERLGELRRFLFSLAQGPAPYELLVSHDQLAVEASSVRPFARP